MAQFTVTFNPTAANTIDSSSSVNYATARGGANLFSEGAIGNVFHYFDGSNYAIHRSFATFDTSSLPDNATIISAFLRFPGTGAIANGDSDTFVVVVSTPASNNSIVTGDWNNIGSTSFGSLLFSAWSTSANNDITLNASGIANISLSGFSDFGARSLRDINNSAPTVDNHVSMTSAVVLSVTYSVPDTGMLLSEI